MRHDDGRQPGDLFRLISDDQKRQLFHRIAAATDGVPVEIIKRQPVHFHRADPAYGRGVAEAVGVSVAELDAVAKAAE